MRIDDLGEFGPRNIGMRHYIRFVPGVIYEGIKKAIYICIRLVVLLMLYLAFLMIVQMVL